jgi:hypothetical protein
MDDRARAVLKELSPAQRYELFVCESELCNALRAYYDQHQANGSCECELCKNAKRAFTARVFVP